MNDTAFLLSIDEAAKALGVSRYFLREGCKAGEIPHIRSGKKYLVNIPKAMELLDRLSFENVTSSV